MVSIVDEVDVKIFRQFSPHLPSEGRSDFLKSPSAYAIGRLIGESPGVVKRRLKLYATQGVLKGVCTEVDPRCFGYTRTAVTMLAQGNFSQRAEQAQMQPGDFAEPLHSRLAPRSFPRALDKSSPSADGPRTTEGSSLIDQPPFDRLRDSLPYLDFVDFLQVGRVTLPASSASCWMRFEIVHRDEEELGRRIGLLEKSLGFGRVLSVAKHKQLLSPDANLSRGELELLGVLRSQPASRIGELSEVLGVDRKTVRRRIRKLISVGAFTYRHTLDGSRLSRGMAFLLFGLLRPPALALKPADFGGALGKSWLTINDHFLGEISLTVYSEFYAGMLERYSEFGRINGIEKPMLVYPIEKLMNPDSRLGRRELAPAPKLRN